MSCSHFEPWLRGKDSKVTTKAGKNPSLEVTVQLVPTKILRQRLVEVKGTEYKARLALSPLESDLNWAQQN